MATDCGRLVPFEIYAGSTRPSGLPRKIVRLCENYSAFWPLSLVVPGGVHVNIAIIFKYPFYHAVLCASPSGLYYCTVIPYSKYWTDHQTPKKLHFHNPINFLLLVFFSIYAQTNTFNRPKIHMMANTKKKCADRKNSRSITRNVRIASDSTPLCCEHGAAHTHRA